MKARWLVGAGVVTALIVAVVKSAAASSTEAAASTPSPAPAPAPTWPPRVDTSYATASVFAVVWRPGSSTMPWVVRTAGPIAGAILVPDGVAQMSGAQPGDVVQYYWKDGAGAWQVNAWRVLLGPDYEKQP